VPTTKQCRLNKVIQGHDQEVESCEFCIDHCIVNLNGISCEIQNKIIETALDMKYKKSN